MDFNGYFYNVIVGVILIIFGFVGFSISFVNENLFYIIGFGIIWLIGIVYVGIFGILIEIEDLKEELKEVGK